jgi:hypothetical protein
MKADIEIKAVMMYLCLVLTTKGVFYMLFPAMDSVYCHFPMKISEAFLDHRKSRRLNHNRCRQLQNVVHQISLWLRFFYNLTLLVTGFVHTGMNISD